MIRALRSFAASCPSTPSRLASSRLAPSRPVPSGARRRRIEAGRAGSGAPTAIQRTPILVRPRTEVERPRLHKVILLNDDYTPREFVVTVLKAEFRMTEEQAFRVMLTAHRRGACVVAVFTRDVAETKAARAAEMAKAQGFPLLFTTEPEE